MHRASALVGLGAALASAACSFPDDTGLDADAGATGTEDPPGDRSDSRPPSALRGVIPIDFGGSTILAYVRLRQLDDLWYVGEIAFATGDVRSAAVHGIAASALPAEDAARWDNGPPPFESGWVFSLAPAYERDLGSWGHMTWTTFQIRAATTDDRTARADAAWVEAFAHLRGDDWIDSRGVDDHFEALTEEEAAELAVLRPTPEFHEPLAPTDGLLLRVGHPIWKEDLDDRVRVLADGDAVPGRHVLDLAGHAQGGRKQPQTVLGSRFQPHLLPPGAQLSVDPGALESTLGYPIEAHEITYETIDAGDVSENLGFETGLDGWGRFEDASAAAELAGVEPVEGDSQLVIDTWGYVAGYLDIPEGAVAIDMTVTVLGDRLARPRIHLATEDGWTRQDVAVEEISALEPCDCAPYDGQAGPMRVTLDVAHAGGQRAGLKIGLNVEHSWWRPPFGGSEPPVSLLVVDDITVR